MRYRRCECKKNPERGTPRYWASQAQIHLRNYREDPTSTLERDFAVMDLNKISGEPKASERLRSDARRAAILLNTAPLSEEAWHAVHSLFPSAVGYRKSHYPMPGRKNPRRKNPFVEGETVVQDYGGGSYAYYKVLRVHRDGSADLYNTGSGQTFKNVPEEGLLDRQTLELIRKRKNPSAVYGAFRARNPDWTETELFAFLRQHPDGITVKELVYGFGGTSQGHTTRLEKLVERGALKRERWAKGGDHYLLPEKRNPVAKYYKVPLSNFTVMTLPEVGMTFYSDGSIHLAQSALPKWKPGSKRRPPLRAPRSYLPVGWWRVIRGGPSSSPLWVQRAELPYVHRDSP